MSNLSYLFLELTILITVYLISQNFIKWDRIFNARSMVKIFLLTIFWFFIDQLAILLNLWNFPIGKTLPFRLFNLPFEEYILFIIHSILCYMLIAVFDND